MTELTFDHLIPRSKGGKTTWDNIVTACAPCNLRKGGKLAEHAKMFPERNPRRPSMEELHARGRRFPPNYLHHTWRDFLYWDTELEA
jgi:5-methylcytosine-specific restriction endonuclease McrA